MFKYKVVISSVNQLTFFCLMRTLVVNSLRGFVSALYLEVQVLNLKQIRGRQIWPFLLVFTLTW